MDGFRLIGNLNPVLGVLSRFANLVAEPDKRDFQGCKSKPDWRIVIAPRTFMYISPLCDLKSLCRPHMWVLHRAANLLVAYPPLFVLVKQPA